MTDKDESLHDQAMAKVAMTDEQVKEVEIRREWLDVMTVTDADGSKAVYIRNGEGLWDEVLFGHFSYAEELYQKGEVKK